MQLCLQIPLSDVISFVKLSKAYFSFFEILFRSHLDVLCGLDSSIFIQLIRHVQEGLQSGGTVQCSNHRSYPTISNNDSYLMYQSINQTNIHTKKQISVCFNLFTTSFHSFAVYFIDIIVCSCLLACLLACLLVLVLQMPLFLHIVQMLLIIWLRICF